QHARVGRKTDRAYRAALIRNRRQESLRTNVPNPNLPVRTCGNEFSIARKCRSAGATRMVLQLTKAFLSGDVREFHDVSLRPEREDSTSRREVQMIANRNEARNNLGPPIRRRRAVPKFHRPVESANGQPFSVRREGHLRSFVCNERGCRSRSKVPQAHGEEIR